MKKILLIVALVTTMSSAWEKWEKAKVTYVEDGDTIYLTKKGKSTKVRLIGLDTFETKMNHRVFMQLATLKDIHPRKKHSVKEVLRIGHETKSWVKERFLNKEVEYKSYGFDKYDRLLVYVKNLNYLLIRSGWAIQYPTNKLHPKRKTFLLDASREANKEELGIYKKVK